MARKLKFDLTVDASALLCPNPNEFYSKAYITEDIVDNYRTLAGIKYKTEIANVLFDANLLKASNCTWSAGTDTIASIPVDVCAVSAMAQICRFDLEQSFVSQWMAKGSGAPMDPSAFMSYYFDEMSKHIAANIESIRWKGNTAVNSNDIYELCTGYEAKLCADAAVVQIASTTVTASNVVAEMNKLYTALTPALQGKLDVLRFFVSSNVAAALRQAGFALGNANILAVNSTLNLNFAGIKVVVAQGMTANTMVLTSNTNLIYAFDGDNDAKVLKAVNLEDSVAEPLLRTRADIKIGFYYVNPSEIVFYSAGPCS